MRMYLRPPRLAEADEIAAACARSEQARLLSRLGSKPSAPAMCAICLEETAAKPGLAAQGSTTLASPPPPSKAQTHSPHPARPKRTPRCVSGGKLPKEPQQQVLRLGCGHQYHVACLCKAVRHGHTCCPLCRSALPSALTDDDKPERSHRGCLHCLPRISTGATAGTAVAAVAGAVMGAAVPISFITSIL